MGFIEMWENAVDICNVLQGKHLEQSVAHDFKQTCGTSNSPSSLGILISMAGTLVQKYRPLIELWRCYASKHGYKFVLDTATHDVLDTEWLKRRSAWTIQYSHMNRSASKQNSAYYWLKWVSAAEHLALFDWLLVVDGDTLISPPCQHIRLLKLLKIGHVVVKDYCPQCAPNSGVAFIRNSAHGHLFLKLLLEKRTWWDLSGDQDAFGLTLIEMLFLEHAHKSKAVEQTFASLVANGCIRYALPRYDSTKVEASFAACWHAKKRTITKSILLSSGGANFSTVQFLDATKYDINNLNGIDRRKLQKDADDLVFKHSLSSGPLISHFAGHRDMSTQLFGAIAREFSLPSSKTLESNGYANLCQQWSIQKKRECRPGMRSWRDRCVRGSWLCAA